MTTLETAQADFVKKDHRLRIAVGILLGYIVIMLSLVTVITLVTQSTIARNQKTNAAASDARFKRYTQDNAAEHQKTQQYVRCIAQVLLLPIESRTNESFDVCSTTGTYNGKSSGNTSQPTTSPQSSTVNGIAPAQSQSSAASLPSSQVTTSAPPPDPDQATSNPQTTILGLPAPSSILKVLGL